MLFVDVYSRYMWPYYIKEQSEAAKCLKEFHAMVEWQSNHGKLVTIRTDNAKEFVEGEFSLYCRQQGIQHQTTAPYSSASNSIVE
jgi:transposase InsO family protein